MSLLQFAHNSQPIYARERGAGPALILVNGMSQSTANWTSQIARLSTEFRVLAWDCRGQGRSPAGESATLDDHCADLVGVLDHYEVEAAHVVGFSHGARVALRCAATRPERVRSLVLTSIGAGGDARRAAIVRAWAEILRLGGVEALAWCSLTHILGPRFLSENADHLALIVDAVVQRNSPEGIGAMMAAMRSYPPSIDDALKVRAPGLLISAGHDPLVSAASSAALKAAIAHCESLHIAESGHTVPVECATEWRDGVSAFLRRH